MELLYFLVALIATTLGSLAGIGGGVIIKPAMDFLGHYDLATISVVSTLTVLSMAIVATWKKVKGGYKPKKQIYYLAFGSIIGGVLGKFLFTYLLKIMAVPQASALQATMLLIILLLVLIKKWLPTFHYDSHLSMILIGLGLGTLASFLGIGGGPINIMVLMMFLGMDIKESAVTSIVVILLSQLAKVVTLLISGGIIFSEIGIVVFMIPAAIAGALIGAKLHNLMTEKSLHTLFDIIVILLIILNGYNAFNFISALS